MVSTIRQAINKILINIGFKLIDYLEGREVDGMKFTGKSVIMSAYSCEKNYYEYNLSNGWIDF